MTRAPTPDARRFAPIGAEHGFTLVVVLAVMLVSSLLLVAAFTAADGEIKLTSIDRAQKKAYYAAEAGVANYEYHLTQDGNYLSYCAKPPSTNEALNEVGETKHKAKVPGINGEPSQEEYAIQLLPAESDTLENDHHCDPNHLVETMLEEKGTATGTFRIESTGYSDGEERTLVATFRNANFVSYVWYTKYETADPSVHGEVPKGQKPEYWKECGQFYGKRPGQCTSLDNYFVEGETVNGPMHTEDHAGVCGAPVFGRTSSDRIEFRTSYQEDEGYSRESCGGAAKPLFQGTHVPPNEVPSVEPPPGDEELKHIVEPAYEYTGRREIVLEGNTMSVSKWTEKGGVLEKETKAGVPFPNNGIIFVAGGCSGEHSPFGPKPSYTQDNSCGNVYVHGEYTSSLTIAAENDLIINGPLTGSGGAAPSGNTMLGLIANNFVRIYHPVPETYSAGGGACRGSDVETAKGSGICQYTNNASGCDAPNGPEDLVEPKIYAAILAVQHALIVDNFECGEANLGHLNIIGTVAGTFTNGMTGVFSGTTVIHGYPYNLQYDDRLQVEEPPHFLNPIQAAWYVQRQTIAPNP